MLVVDDSKAMRMIILRSLRLIGVTDVEQAGNGREALLRLETGPRPCAMLVDWHMPEMDGLELVAAVRALPAFAAMKIVMVTTEAEINRVMSALEAGADEYITKPFTEDVLKQKLELLGLLG